MAARKGDQPDILSAAIFIGFGVLALFLGRELPAGSLSQMGPGYLPRAVGTLLIVLGLAVGLPALRRPFAGIERISPRPVLVITISVIVFAYAATHLGFVLASLLLIVLGSLADPGGRWRTVGLLAVGLTIFGALVFVYGLGVQVPLWPAFLTEGT
ncbi:tripartite tricarboxylate transporter TctB family protein [Falsirhodobacter sp. 20TX0035]|uniref:tripartite tricarboxylate transporter TctB family protein n=1 Tax=Falsirhodobacter sp. 20TX0035 TaxID=3022019 RepID=UPI00232F11D7|nr:tripartite tricarboxylate transporter TctB family protein [Falsirhodobacter sp. 20TX0035]MDB6454242.1 tripartite tricarboxylate transporter TctB family protein [Falsirhodobacter sp. 20TX0035]